MDTDGPASAGGGEGEGEGALADLVRDPGSRRKFLRMVGGAGAVGAFTTLAAACGETTVPFGNTQADPGTVSQFGPGDLGIVNFALMLEYLEEEFYEKILDSGEVTDRDLRILIEDVYQNEFEHARALERVAEQLGRPLRRPNTDFEEVLAGGQERILKESAVIENVGSSAYLGQAPRIVDRQILASALSIHTVEARHSAAFNEMAGRGFKGKGQLVGSVPDGPFAKPMNMEQVYKAAKKYLPDGIPELEAPGVGV